MVASPTPPTGDLPHNPGMYPARESNQQPFGLQDSTQSTEPHQLGPIWSLCKNDSTCIKYLRKQTAHTGCRQKKEQVIKLREMKGKLLIESTFLYFLHFAP